MTPKEAFLDRDFNCAEAVLLLASERFDLGITPEELRLVSGYGGGLGCGENCGALLGAVAALSRLLVKDRAHATPGFREICAGFVARFREELGSIQCEELKARYREPDVRCLYVVERTMALLEEYRQTL